MKLHTMEDNDSVRKPPKPPQLHQMPFSRTEVPEATIFSPQTSSKTPCITSTTNRNFLERAYANEKVLNIPKKTSTDHHHSPGIPMLKFVPEVTVLECQQNMNPTNLFTGPPISSKHSANLFYKNQQTSQKNVEGIGRSLVPDVTLLDEPKKQQPKSNSTDQVFSESYKKMIIDSHEQFMKQIRSDDQPAADQVPPPTKKRSGLFNSQVNRYHDNPLRQYAPRPQPAAFDANSSSILVDFEETFSPQKETDERGELPPDKVSEMLSKIQKMGIPSAVSRDEVRIPRKCEVLRHLATSYLTAEELDFFDVYLELDDMEANDGS